MSGINKVILVGNVGKDPEVRTLEGGAAVAKFPLATTESYKNKEGQRVDQAEWHNIVMWRGLADIAGKFLRKGMLVYIEGKIRSRSWEDKEGNKRYITEIVADNMTMLSRKQEEGHASSSDNDQNSVSHSAPSGDQGGADDLPF